MPSLSSRMLNFSFYNGGSTLITIPGWWIHSLIDFSGTITILVVNDDLFFPCSTGLEPTMLGR
jgi:hypothetical protein